MRLTRALKPLVPPVLWNVGRDMTRRLVRSVDHYAHAPAGWQTPLPAGNGHEAYWRAFLAREQQTCEALIARLRATPAILPPDDHSAKYIAFGYVLALAARRRDSLTMLDYGGNLGEYYWLGKALVPGIELEFHCKELPAIAAAGRRLTPDAIWHTDDSCLEGSFDLTMFSSSLQYLSDWKTVVEQAAAATRGYLFLSDIPAVRESPAYVMTQRCGGMINLQWALNRSEIVTSVERIGLRLVREWTMSSHPPVTRAPEQPTAMGWLFSRR